MYTHVYRLVYITDTDTLQYSIHYGLHRLPLQYHYSLRPPPPRR